MGRPPLDIGTYGKIRTYEHADGSWKATTLYRGANGETKPVKRHGETKAKAERALKKALTEKQDQRKGLLSPDMKFRDAAPLWLAEVKRLRAGTTYDTYRRNLAHRVMPAFGGLRLSECDGNVPLVHRFLRGLEDEEGLKPNMVRSCRTVVSGVLAFAAQQGAIKVNPVRDAGRVEGGSGPVRALRAFERVDLLAKLDADEKAVEADLPDLLRYFLGTGVRLGEALGLRWFRVDLDEGVVVHGDNLVSITGQGQVLKEPKSEAGFRVLPLPDFVLLMLQLRYPGERYDTGPVFPNSLGGWRDRNNTGEMIRQFRSRAGYEWVTSHTFRRTAATVLDEQKLTPRGISGYMGHARPSFTQDKYMDKRAEDRAAGEAMDRAMRPQR